MPAIPLLALVAAPMASASSSRRQPPAASRCWRRAVVGLLLGLHAWHAVRVDRAALVIDGPSDRGIDTPRLPALVHRRPRRHRPAGSARYARPDDYAAVGGAGAQVYFSTIRSLDCYGLSDEHIAHQVAANTLRPGHQKYAPVDYILSRKPDDHHVQQLPHRRRALRRAATPPSGAATATTTSPSTSPA